MGIHTIGQVVPPSPPSIHRTAACALCGSSEEMIMKLASAESTSADGHSGQDEAHGGHPPTGPGQEVHRDKGGKGAAEGRHAAG